MAKKRIGRPPTGITPRRQLGRVADEDWDLICQAAEILGQSKTAFMTETLLNRARRVVNGWRAEAIEGDHAEEG